MKRMTVLKMLKKRLAESKHSITVSHQYEDIVNVLGGNNSKENQYRTNMEKDIDELEFVINCLNTPDRTYCTMTPKEKALELYEKMSWFTHGYVGSSMLSNLEFEDAKKKNTKDASLIIVEEILNANPTWFIDQMRSTHKYWECVSTELNTI